MKPLGILVAIVVLATAGFGLYDYYSNPNPETIPQAQATATPIAEFAANPESQPGGNIQPQPTSTPAPVYVGGAGIWIRDEGCLTCWTDQWGNDTSQPWLWHDPTPVGCDSIGPSDPEHPWWPPYCSAEALQLAVANGYATTNEPTQVVQTTEAPTGVPQTPPMVQTTETDQPDTLETPSGESGNGWKIPFWVYLVGGAILIVVLKNLPKIMTAASLTGTSHEVHTVPDGQGGWQECGHQHGFLWGLFHWGGSQLDARTPTGDVKGWSSAEKRWTVHFKGMGCALAIGLVFGVITILIIVGMGR